MTTPAALGHLERARAGIRQAVAGWNPVDLPQVADAHQKLEEAAGEMRRFESAVRNGSVPQTAAVWEQVKAAKQEIVRAARIVDACVAFQRGLAARIGGAPPVYDAAGRLAGESGETVAEMHG